MPDGRLRIRPAEYSDLESVYRFICSLESAVIDFTAFGTVFHRNLRKADCVYLVAEQAEVPAGFASLHIQELLHHAGRVGEIQELFVATGSRRHGIARALIEEILRVASERQVGLLEVTMNLRRNDAMALYEVCGFTGTHRKYTRSIQK